LIFDSPINHELSVWLSVLENQHPQEIQLGLERIKTVAATMNLLHPKATVITVAGTNGKGSTVAMLESIYHAAAYKVAAYTSPHLISFTERIRVNKQPIAPADLIKAFKHIEQAKGSTHLTYFETATLAALHYFKQCEAEVIILEVGLGGRLDATNIIDADLAIITTIDLDHQDYLGDNKEKIGYEKAGILRHGQAVIYADTHPPQSIIDQAKSLDCRLYINGIDFDQHSGNWPESRLHPNARAAAIKAIHCLQKECPVSDEQLCQGISQARIQGRIQLINTARPTILDVAHNPQAATHLASYLKRHYPNRNIHAVFSALADKDLPGLIAPMLSCVSAWYPALLSGKRAAPAQSLLDALNAHELDVSLCYNDPVLAYQAACKQAAIDDLIVVYGSFLTVTAVLEITGIQSNDLSE